MTPFPRWYAPGALRGRVTTTCCVLAALFAVGCGASADGPGANKVTADGSYTVDIPSASFPKLQRLDRNSAMKVAVRNTGDRTIPNVAMSVSTDNEGTSAPAFAKRDPQRGLAEPYQPVWIVDVGPINGDTAMANTATLGPLEPGATKTFIWQVHPVRTGDFTLRWKVSAATLGGEVQFASGEPAQGEFAVTIDGQPAKATVKPNGRVKKSYPN